MWSRQEVNTAGTTNIDVFVVKLAVLSLMTFFLLYFHQTNNSKTEENTTAKNPEQ